MIRVAILSVIMCIGSPTMGAGPQQLDSHDDALDSQIGLRLHKASVAVALATIGERSGLSIVLDSVVVPTEINLDYNGPTSGAVSRVSDQCDCKWRRVRSGQVVLSSQFRNPSTHPQFDLAEALETAASISRMLRRFPDPPVQSKLSDCLRNLFVSMSNEQRAAAVQRRLTVKDLSASQQGLAEAAIIHQGFGGLRYFVDTLGSQLSRMDESEIALRSSPDQVPAPTGGSTVEAAPELIYYWRRGATRHRISLPHAAGFTELQGQDAATSPGTLPAEGTLSAGSQMLLDKPANLPAGQMTIAQVAGRLSDATGLVIEASGPVAGRKVILSATSTNARRVLDLACDAIGARWFPAGANKIVLARPVVRNPRTISEAFGAVRSMLPNEWRAFLAQEPPEESTADPGTSQHNNLMRKMGFYASRVAIPSRRREIAGLERKYADVLVSAVKQKPNRTELAFADMDSGQREALVNCLVLDALEQICGTPCAESLLLGKLLPYHVDPGSALVTIKNDGISIESVVQQNGFTVGQGFGASIPVRVP